MNSKISWLVLSMVIVGCGGGSGTNTDPDAGGGGKTDAKIDAPRIDTPAGTDRPDVSGPSCSDGVLNGNETAIDCGGTCLGCPGGAVCRIDQDCRSGKCLAGACQDIQCNSDG